MGLAEGKGIASGDPWGGGFNPTPTVTHWRASFLIPLPLTRASPVRVRETRKCPAKGRALLSLCWRREGDKFRTFLGKI